MVTFSVNGTSRSFDGDEDMPLLWYLRDDLRLTGTRFGCGAGLCGACTVHVDGAAVRSCQTPLKALAGKKVRTIEGLSPDGAHPLQQAWMQHNVPQCGYCQSGQIMAAAAMLEKTPAPTDADIDRVMTGNICRCGTYQRIRAAIKSAAANTAKGTPRMSPLTAPSAPLRDAVRNVSRRDFLGGLVSAGAFVVAAQVVPDNAWAQDAAVQTRAQRAPLHPSVYLGIEPDGTVFLVTHRSEMGTGIRTSLPLVAADELDADWSRCRIEQALGDAKYGDQNTDGSRSVRDFYDAFRRAGASARVMLVSAAATQWGVPASECTTAKHEVVHRGSNRRLGYGALVSAAAALPVPAPETLTFKTRGQWTLVGKDQPIYDLTDITTGKAQFGLDVFRDGMVHASIEHPPVLGGSVKSLNDTDAKAVRGVRQTVTLDTFTPPHLFKPLGGVAVIADNTWAALQGRKRLKVEWTDGPHAAFSSDPFTQELIASAQKPGKAFRNLGNVEAEFARGGKTIEATYTTPMGAHAAMEPPAAVAEFVNGKVTVWAPVQDPQGTQDTVAAATGVKKEDVTVHVTLLGGGFGRKSKPDYCAEAAILAKQLGKPVKVVWTREDDLRFDFYHAAAAVYHKATVDAKGKPTAWLARSAFQPIASTFEANATSPMPMELDLGLTDLPYAIANIRAENGPAGAGVRIGWFRAVTNNFHVFASGSFADELAFAAGRDPLEFLLDLIGPGQVIDLKAKAQGGLDYANYGVALEKYPLDTRRLRKVLEVAAEKSAWGKRKSGNGWGLGIAAHYSFNSYVASVVEVEMDGKGSFRVPRVHQVIDCGIAINPDRVRAQLEGAAVMAVGMARTGEITAAAGRIQQSNFHQFRVPRMNDAPVQVDVHIVESGALPTGVGEPGVPPAIAAVSNAVFAASGTRVRDLPMSKTKFV